jgi:uroporphyrinogen decarboxylase
MTPKERVRTALARRQPDRLPSFVLFNTDTRSGPINTGGPSAQENIMRHLQTDDYEVVLRRLGVDIREVAARPAGPDADREAAYARIAQGVRDADSVEELRGLPQPGWDLIWDLSHVREDLERILEAPQRYAILLSGPSVWEIVRKWRGFDRSLMDWATRPELMVAAFEMGYQLYMPAYEVMAEKLGSLVNQVDIIYAGSDFGMQDRLMLAPELFARDYEPLVKREVRRFKELFPDAFFEFHSCGAVAEIIPSLLRAGVEVLDPVQPGTKGMDFTALKSAYGDRLAFRGGVDARILSRGAVDDVRRSVMGAFRTLGKGGGFIISAHGVMPEVPVENVLALFDSVRRECWY